MVKAAKQQADVPPLSALSSTRPARLHVLAVDDNAIDRKVAERLLIASAFKVTTAESGFKALQILGIGCQEASVAPNAYDINLIITDYYMPGMTGYDFLKRVKETPALKDIPVVIISSENSTDLIAKCLAEGAEEFLPKPLKVYDVKRLKSLTCRRRSSSVEKLVMPLSVKRTAMSDSLPTKNAERRPRLDIVTVS